MQPTNLAGRKLKPGTSLLICPWQLQRDPRHFEQPEKFLMTRRYTTDAYVPFGAGPRACAGMGVAMLELQLLALEVAAAYRFTSVIPMPAPWPKASVTLIPPPMDIGIELRQAGPRLVASAPHVIEAPRRRLDMAAAVQASSRRQQG
jgi:cytochrome P450